MAMMPRTAGLAGRVLRRRILFKPRPTRVARCCHGLRCEKREVVDDCIRESYKFKDALVMPDFGVALEESVYPMSPAARALAELVYVPLEQHQALDVTAKQPISAPRRSVPITLHTAA